MQRALAESNLTQSQPVDEDGDGDIDYYVEVPFNPQAWLYRYGHAGPQAFTPDIVTPPPSGAPSLNYETLLYRSDLTPHTFEKGLYDPNAYPGPKIQLLGGPVMEMIAPDGGGVGGGGGGGGLGIVVLIQAGRAVIVRLVVGTVQKMTVRGVVYFLAEQGAELAIETATGIPVILSPGDVAEWVSKGYLKKVISKEFGEKIGYELTQEGAKAASRKIAAATRKEKKDWLIKHALEEAKKKGADKAPNSKYADLTDPKARRHILDGDATGGGHRPGTGIPRKSEFPKGWSDDRILDAVSDVATDPKVVWSRPDKRGYITGTKTIDGIDIKVVFDTKNGRIVTGYPTNVPRNP